QFQMPTLTSRLLLESVARYVGRLPHPKYPAAKAVRVKIYRVIHWIPQPGELAQGADPRHPTYFFPYYMGDYDVQEQAWIPTDDPSPYWLRPTVVDPETPGVISAYVFLHGGDTDPQEWQLPLGRRPQQQPLGPLPQRLPRLP